MISNLAAFDLPGLSERFSHSDLLETIGEILLPHLYFPDQEVGSKIYMSEKRTKLFKT